MTRRRQRKPVVLTRRLIFTIYRMRRNGNTCLSICQNLNIPYQQVWDVLNPALNLKVAGKPRASNWIFGPTPAPPAAQESHGA